jgi:NitT/TauT family transport system substrate-binding protein
MMEEKVKMSKIGKSLSLVAVVLLVTVVSLTACARAVPAQQFTLRIGILGIQADLPYFVMQEKGFYKKYGLQFVETSYTAGTPLIEALAVNELDVSLTVSSVAALQAAERGLIPSKVISIAGNNFCDPEHPSVGVLVAPTTVKWQDLQGKQIATPGLKTITSAAIIGRLEQEGVSDYKLVEISFANMGLAVAGGNVAAAAMSEPYLTQSLLRKDGRLLGWVMGGPPLDRAESTMITVSADIYRNNPEAVKAFLRAHLQAVKWITQNPDSARSILVKRLSLSAEVGQNIQLSLWPLDAHNDPALLESMQPLLVKIGLLKALIPANQLYDETLLNEVLAEKR